DPEKPDELRIDIDPQPGTGFAEAREVAAVVHEVLDEIGYVGWPKTSGNRGVHVYCRIEPNWEFRVVRRCALAFARELERRAPYPPNFPKMPGEPKHVQPSRAKKS